MKLAVYSKGVDQTEFQRLEVRFHAFLEVPRSHRILLVIICGSLETWIIRQHQCCLVFCDYMSIETGRLHSFTFHPDRSMTSVYRQENAHDHADSLPIIQVSQQNFAVPAPSR